jgi:ABC-type uncharacterized transport system ATPase subunit
VVVLDRGAVVAAGPIQELKRHEARVIELRVKGETRPFLDALAADGVACTTGAGELMRLFVPDAWTPQTVFRRAAEHHLQVRHLRVGAPTLEDVFAGAIAEEP